jgi:phosphatidylglycerol---prolipoprotein diacylglyceryl transferase
MLSIAFPVIDPVAIEIGPLAIRWYSLAYVFGILLGWRYMLRLAGRGDVPGIERRTVDDFVLWATLGIIVGGRLGFVLFYRPGHYLANPLEIFALWQGGMAFHGGLLGVLVAIVVFARRRGLPVLSFGDMVCAAAPIGLFLGRIANFINGELYGRVSDVPWAMVFPRGGPEPRHPSQLYEATLEGLVLFIVLAVMIYRFGALRRPGLISGAFLLGYGIARFLVELVREPDPIPGIDWLTMGQALSLPLVAGGLWLTWYALRQR